MFTIQNQHNEKKVINQWINAKLDKPREGHLEEVP